MKRVAKVWKDDDVNELKEFILATLDAREDTE